MRAPFAKISKIKTGRSIPTEKPDDAEGESNLVVSNDAVFAMSPADILDLAIEKEDASFRLYVSLLARVQDPHSKEVLLGLAEEEVHHKILLQSEYERLLNG